jgi:hypothetical protein
LDNGFAVGRHKTMSQCFSELRCDLWKRWGQAGYREPRKRGVSVHDAWNTGKSAHGPWRVSQTPARSIALPLRFFDKMGVPSLAPQ